MATMQASPETASYVLPAEVVEHIVTLHNVQRKLGHGNFSATWHYDDSGALKIVTFVGPAGKIYLNP